MWSVPVVWSLLERGSYFSDCPTVGPALVTSDRAPQALHALQAPQASQALQAPNAPQAPQDPQAPQALQELTGAGDMSGAPDMGPSSYQLSEGCKIVTGGDMGHFSLLSTQ